VERLRRAADTSAGGGGEWYQLVHRCREAADEIERLRAAGDALAEVADEWPELIETWQGARK
jgi:hypothetical protein